jgi:DNA repair exonuclease SbcCD ATPase subunit
MPGLCARYQKKTKQFMKLHLKSKAHEDRAAIARANKLNEAELNLPHSCAPHFNPTTYSSTFTIQPSILGQYINPVDVQIFSLPQLDIEEGPSSSDLAFRALQGLSNNVGQFQGNINRCTSYVAQGIKAESEDLKALEAKFRTAEAQHQKELKDMRGKITASEERHNHLSVEASSRYYEEVEKLKRQLATLARDLEEHLEEWKQRYASSELITKIQLGQMALYRQQSGDQTSQLQQRIDALESELTTMKPEREIYNETVSSLESALQLNTEELDALRRNQQYLQTNLLARIKHASDNAEEWYHGLEIETCEKISAFERGVFELGTKRIDVLERETSLRMNEVEMLTEKQISSLEVSLGEIKNQSLGTAALMELMEVKYRQLEAADTATSNEIQLLKEFHTRRLLDVQEACSRNIKSLKQVNDEQASEIDNISKCVAEMLKASNNLPKLINNIITALENGKLRALPTTRRRVLHWSSRRHLRWRRASKLSSRSRASK